MCLNRQIPETVTINNAITHIGLLTRSFKNFMPLLFLTFRMYTSDVENDTRAGGKGKLAMSKSATCKYIQNIIIYNFHSSH